MEVEPGVEVDVEACVQVDAVHVHWADAGSSSATTDKVLDDSGTDPIRHSRKKSRKEPSQSASSISPGAAAAASALVSCGKTQDETRADDDAVAPRPLDPLLLGEQRPRAEARGEGRQLLTADEARATAAAEGLELVPSSQNQTGFKGVIKRGSKYDAVASENGAQRRLGNFSTAEEAALCYARYIGAERAATEAAEARGQGYQPMTADEARAAAAAEGLELVPSSKGQTGFKGVIKRGGKYEAVVSENGTQRRLAIRRIEPSACRSGRRLPYSDVVYQSVTPEEAALCYARYIGAERAVAEAAEARVGGHQPMTADEVRAAAAAEGLELVPSSKSQTGFKGVIKRGGKYEAVVSENGTQRRLGTFVTPAEAALCFARHGHH